MFYKEQNIKQWEFQDTVHLGEAGGVGVEVEGKVTVRASAVILPGGSPQCRSQKGNDSNLDKNRKADKDLIEKQVICLCSGSL